LLTSFFAIVHANEQICALDELHLKTFSCGCALWFTRSTCTSLSQRNCCTCKSFTFTEI